MNNIDKLIKEKLNATKADNAMADEVWNTINKTINPSKGLWLVKYKLLIGLAGLLVLGGGIATYYWYATDESSPVAKIETVNETPVENNPTVIQPATESTTNVEANINTKGSNYQPDVSQLNEVVISKNGSINLAKTLIYLQNTKGKHLLVAASDSVKIKIVSQPKNGKVVVDKTTGLFNYEPNYNFYGLDSFQYAFITANGTTTNPATIKINVTDNKTSGSNSKADTLAKNIEPPVATPILSQAPKPVDFTLQTSSNTLVSIDIKKK